LSEGSPEVRVVFDEQNPLYHPTPSRCSGH
jgi:hypothetical protein